MNSMKLNHIKLGFVVSRFNESITDRLLDGALKQCEKKELHTTQYDIVYVPGAIEIPIAAQALARTQRYHAIICLGAVIRGETSHYDYVCQQVSYGCQRVALDEHLPVIFGILTTDTMTQALERCGGKHGHKGEEAVDTALTMIHVLAHTR